MTRGHLHSKSPRFVPNKAHHSRPSPITSRQATPSPSGQGTGLGFLPDRARSAEKEEGERKHELVLLRDVQVCGAERLSSRSIVLQLGDADRHIHSGGDIRPEGLHGGRQSSPP